MKGQRYIFLLVSLVVVCLLCSILPVYAVSTVDTTTNLVGCGDNTNRQVFYANTRFWVFYTRNDTYYISWKSSLDGVTWSAEQSMTGADYGAYDLCIFFDGTYVHVGFQNGTGACYRRGTPNASGTITWSAATQLVAALPVTGSLTITANSSGYPMVAWYRNAGPNNYLYVYESKNNDGTWSTATGFPYTAISSNTVPMLVSDGGNFTLFYDITGGSTLRAKTYNGSAWTAEAHGTSIAVASNGYSVVSEGTKVHTVILNATGYQLLYSLYDSNTNTFGAETQVNGTTTSTAYPSLSRDTISLTVYCFWIQANHLYYKTYVGGAWAVSSTDWLNEAAQGFTATHDFTSCIDQGTGSYVFVDYSTLAASPYNLKFAYIMLNAIPTIGPPTVTWTDTDNCYAQKQSYAIQVVYTDLNGFADINYAEMFIKTGANATRAEFAFCEDTNTFSIVSGSASWEMTGTNSSSGSDITVTWNIKAHWAATEESDLDLFFFVNDTTNAWSNSFSDQNFDVVTTLVTSNLATNDSRQNIAGGVTITGNVYYANDPGSIVSSTSYPPDAEFSQVGIHDAAHNLVGSTAVITNGAFSASFNIPNLVQSNTYHVYLNMADADYPDGDAVDGDTIAVIGDRIKIDTLAVTDAHGNIGDIITFYATAELEYGGHALGTGDSLTLGGLAFTWDPVDSRFEHNETFPAVGSLTINTFTSGNEATFLITVGNINAQTATTIWDALTTFNVQPVQYKGSGGFYYQAQIEWAYGPITILNGATVGVAYPNDTAIGTMTSNSTGWVSFIINQGNATSGNLAIYGINDNNYTVTVTLVNATFTLNSWALNTKDISGTGVSNTNLAITKGATSIWSGTQRTLYIPADTFAVTITWLQSLPVNTTASITIAGATSTNFNCTIYPLSGTSYHLAANTTITSVSYGSDLLSVEFSGPVSTYVLVVDKPTNPTYIINATYDLATCYTPYSYLVLGHYGNRTLQVCYEDWGGLYIQETTHKFLAVSLTGQVVSITATGNVGEIATVEVYCGTRGNAVSTTGWIATSYSSTLSTLTGTLTFASDTTVTLTWLSSGGGTTGGTQPPAISPLIATVVMNFPRTNTLGTVINASVTISWSGVNSVYLQEISIDSDTFRSWQLLIPNGLPETLTMVGSMGSATVPITLSIPADVKAGTYIVPVIVTFGWESGAGTKTFRTVSTLDVVVPPPTVPDLMTYWWVGMFAALGVGMLVLRSRKHSI